MQLLNKQKRNKTKQKGQKTKKKTQSNLALIWLRSKIIRKLAVNRSRSLISKANKKIDNDPLNQWFYPERKRFDMFLSLSYSMLIACLSCDISEKLTKEVNSTLRKIICRSHLFCERANSSLTFLTSSFHLSFLIFLEK